MFWTGSKKIAFIPVHRPSFDSPPPADWVAQIEARVYFDPDARGDRSLRAYLHAASSGLARLEGHVQAMVTIDQDDVPVDALEARLGPALRAQGFDAACIVMRGGVGAGTAEGGGFWARFVMVEDVGVWAMELLHVVTGYLDLYFSNDPNGVDLGGFDEMACNCGTHPTAFTKIALGWLDPGAVAAHVGAARDYALYAIGGLQPPPPARRAAVRIAVGRSTFWVEARQASDHFDAGVPSFGVIVYEVAAADLDPSSNTRPLIYLRTPTALAVGDRFQDDGAGLRVEVSAELPGGYAVTIARDVDGECSALAQQIAQIEARIEALTDGGELTPQTIRELAMLRRRLRALQAQANALGCPLP